MISTIDASKVKQILKDMADAMDSEPLLRCSKSRQWCMRCVYLGGILCLSRLLTECESKFGESEG
jgi:hypothetical protein